MPQLLLLRHAKSSWDGSGTADIDRPLSARGRRAAAAMAETIATRALIPDRILCSPAQRTRETLAALMPHLPARTAIAIAPELYEPIAGDYRATIAAHGDGAGTLMVIGHNPAIPATALILISAGDARLSSDIARKYPTGALATIVFPTGDWSRLSPHSGRIEAFLKPRDLDGADDGEDGD